MKLLLILLACIAATSAYSYGGSSGCYRYSYKYYCQRKFLVYPKSSCYSFRIYFRDSWCSYKYYAPVLKVYPGEKCGTEGWSERPCDEVYDEMQNALNESLLKITEKMTEKKTEWENCLSEKIAAYKEQYKTCMHKHYAYRIACASEEEKAKLEQERDRKINEYHGELDKCKDEARTKYCEAMVERVTCLKEYHQKLLDNAKSCLETRIKKINEYSESVGKKIDDYVKQFTDCHVAILDQKEKCYRALLDCIHGKNFEPEKTNAVIQHFRDREMITINKLVDEYAARLDECRNTLITYYRCAYRCYLSTACLRFYKKSYYSSCRRLGCWYRYKSSYCVRKYRFHPFQQKYRKVGCYSLKTCKELPIKTVPEIVKPLTEKMEAVIKCATERFTTWHTKWEQYHVEYKRCYEEIMRKRHEWCIYRLRSHYYCINNSTVLTPEQEAKIAELKAELEAKLVKSCDEYAAKLAASLLECKTTFEKSVEEYRTKVTEMITKIGEDYQKCLNTRAEKVREYEEKLKNDIYKKKTDFFDEQNVCKVSWAAGYKKMYQFYHGEELPEVVTALSGCHIGAVIAECDRILYDYYDELKLLLPKLLRHYECCYSCRVGRFCLPTFCFGGYFKWTVKYPTACYYRYQYKCYRRTYSYRCRYVKSSCRYVYC